MSILSKNIHIDTGVIANSLILLKQLDIGKNILVVSDQNTTIFAQEIADNIASHYDIEHLVIRNAYADIETVEHIMRSAQTCDAIIAVGSGTINDLCKYSSYRLDKQYVVYGTAASMNGYASANASISVSGYKSTLKAHLPLAIYLDLDVLCDSPKKLMQSGVGDSICRSTAQADWLLSHLILGTYYNQNAFDMLRDSEDKLFYNISDLLSSKRSSQLNAMKYLAQNLILSGIGMYDSGGSFPASQGEHMIAHTMEMMQFYPSSLEREVKREREQEEFFHGQQIAVTTVTMAQIQADILDSSNDLMVSPINIDKDEIYGLFGDKVGKNCIEQINQKNKLIAGAKPLNHEIKDEIKQVKIATSKIKDILKSIGAPRIPVDIGWSDDQYQKAVSIAKMTRNRFTFLDL